MFPKMKAIGQDAYEVGSPRCTPSIILLSAPLCPKPPDIPIEGVIDFEPIVFGLKSEESIILTLNQGHPAFSFPGHLFVSSFHPLLAQSCDFGLH